MIANSMLHALTLAAVIDSDSESSLLRYDLTPNFDIRSGVLIVQAMSTLVNFDDDANFYGYGLSAQHDPTWVVHAIRANNKDMISGGKRSSLADNASGVPSRVFDPASTINPVLPVNLKQGSSKLEVYVSGNTVNDNVVTAVRLGFLALDHDGSPR